ncbi:hypothetical protein B0H15DRAFT_813958 [Mycena belliarum]|uniref:Rho-GAP domain-containing protein n=1 Tax=Mycena belliarum TaxID=1033014 RepID=A0AAD6Y131_9AGAR|nr:hypothetical protein B0H15DRAFT_813958 [Mycena belliae]
MPSFLSKVFGRKKDDTKESRSQHRPSSDASLLEGKFEAVPTLPSPITPRFDIQADGSSNDKEKEKEKDGFALFKNKSVRTPPVATPDQSFAPSKTNDYHLSLNLPGPKEESSRALGVVFEADPDAQILLSESDIAERKLSPLEAFLLVQACSQAINSRGLETLGIMIPHWYSASPAVQRRLISLFIQSLAPKSPITTLSPTASSPVSAFESEISATRSPHDVAAVLRWAIRHLQLDNSSFGKDEQWYSQFLQAEKAANYPPRAFTDQLVPLLPSAHLHLLTAALEIFSSLAAHGEANSISGSKLSKMFGLWLLSVPRVKEGDDVLSFYARWEKWGHIMEHLFLARIRDEAADHRMPTRLMELVKHYPYVKSPSTAADATFFPSPRFSTRLYDALFVRIETEMLTESGQHKNHPLRLIADALKASTRSASSPDPSNTASPSSELELWEALKKHVSVADADSESYPGLSNLFADETIRFLSLIPTASDIRAKSQDPPPFTLFVPASKVGRRRSMSLSDQDKATAVNAAAHVKAASSNSSGTASTDPLALDWGQFSTSGFFSENGDSSDSKLAATLLDNKDVEVTIPRKSSTRRKLPPALIPLPSSRGKSLDLPAAHEEKEVKQGKSKATKFAVVQLDEAFIDFWSDALLDPISSDWPAFVVCKIKSSVPANTADGKKIGWLIIEQRLVTARPPLSVVTTTEKEPQARPRPTSPKPSFHSDSKSTKKKRFSFFTSLSSSSVSSASTTKTDGTKGKKKTGKGPKVGEMGEILKEEEEEENVPATAKSNGTEPAVPVGIATLATGVVALGTTAVVAAAAANKTEDNQTEERVEPEVKREVPPSSAPSVAEQVPTPPLVVMKEAVAEPEAALVEAEVAAREPSPPPAVVQPELPVPGAVVEEERAANETETVARELTPPPRAAVDAQSEVEEPVVEASKSESIPREPTPPPVQIIEPILEAAAAIPRESTPPLVTVESEVAEPIVEAPSEPEREPTPPPSEPEVEESMGEAALDPQIPPRQSTPPSAEPEVELPNVEAAPEPETIPRESTPPIAVTAPEPQTLAQEPLPTPKPIIEIVEVPREPTPPPPVEPDVEETAIEVVHESEAVLRQPTPPPAVEPEVEESIVEAMPEPEVIPREPSPAPVEVEEPINEAAEGIAREPTPPPAVEPQMEKEPIVEAAPEAEVIAREPTPPPDDQSQVEDDAVEASEEPTSTPLAEPESLSDPAEESLSAEAEAPAEPDAVPERIERGLTPSPPHEPTPLPAVVEGEAAADPEAEPVPYMEPIEAPPEAGEATSVEEAIQMPIVEPASQEVAEGLQFNTVEEVDGSAHMEQLREPEAANDELVDIPAVPVVDVGPDLVRGSTMISQLAPTPSPEEAAPEELTDGLLPGGETPGPQVALGITEEDVDEAPAVAEEDAVVHANGNGADGHEHTDKPSE